MFRKWVLAAALAADLVIPAIDGHSQEREAVITCVNPVSGTSWQIVVDYSNATVDSNPAEVSRNRISWFDPRDGGNYMLDRKSGALRVSVASSTGGYFRHARCSVEKSQ